MTLIDRESEIAELRALAADGARHIALLVGRRRVGKTFLLTRAWPESTPVLYFTASATAPEYNRRALLREARNWSGDELHEEDYPTWRSVFRTLFELRPAESVVIILDEFQYLATSDTGMREIASELNAVWEGRVRRDGGLLLVLSGSAVHTLRSLEADGAPLFGRIDWRRRLEPFDVVDAGRMMPAYGPADRIRAYAAFGGTPKYLDAVNDSRPVDHNIIELLLAPDGRVRIQVETALDQEEGLRDVAAYRGILAAIGLKRREQGEIAAALGRESDAALRRMLKELVRLGYLEEIRNFDAPGNQAIRYRLSDPAMRFYYGLVLPHESAIATAGARAVWKDRIAPGRWRPYVGQEVFEDVVRQIYLRRMGDADGDPPTVEEWGRWQGRDRRRGDVEIDIVARLLDGRMLTGAAKFRSRAAGARLLLDHAAALERLADSGEDWAREALDPRSPFLFVSTGGFTDSFEEVRAEQAERPIIVWTLGDLG